MNPGFDKLQSYPFEKLDQLLRDSTRDPNQTLIDLTIGEPAHATPGFILETLVNKLSTTAKYPPTRGLPEFRAAITEWLTQRYRLEIGTLSPDAHVLPLNGTREGLFAIAQFWVDATRGNAIVVMPNPGYQVYEGAALLAGAKPYYMNLTPANDYGPDFASVPETIWRQCQLLYLCSPANPTGHVLSREHLGQIVDLAQEYDFLVVADECYAELYNDETAPPAGILQAAQDRGCRDFRNCLALHSLSKRSNVPGLRSGFVAGDPEILSRFLRYRTYHGCAMPLYTQYASIAAWRDEDHVRANRVLYRAKFDAVGPILSDVLEVKRPVGGFYYWLRIPGDDQEFVKALYERQGVKLIPGTFLARAHGAANPGAEHVRMALVPELAHCVEAAQRIKNFLQ